MQTHLNFGEFMEELARARKLSRTRRDSAHGAAHVFALCADGSPQITIAIDPLLQDATAQMEAHLSDVPREPYARACVMGRALEFNHAHARQTSAAIKLQDADDADENTSLTLRREVATAPQPRRDLARLVLGFAHLAASARTELERALPPLRTL